VDTDQNQDLTAWSGEGTNIYAINAAGTTTGTFQDANGIYHGLVRAADGKMTVFDAPRAPVGAHSIPQAINDEGAVVGFYNDATVSIMASCGLPMASSLTLTIPRAGISSIRVLPPCSLVGHIASGFYEDSDYVWHGFEWNGADGRGFDWK